MNDRGFNEASGKNPPSFIPSGRSQRPTTSNTKPASPQSFRPQHTPSRRSTPAARQNDAGNASATTPPSFSPSGNTSSRRRSEPRTASGSTASSSNSNAQPTSYRASRTSNAHSSYTAGASNRMPSSSAFNASQSARKAKASPSRSRVRGAASKSVRWPKRLLIVLVALLVAALLACLSLANWVNGQLTHKDMLSSAANTPASTWLILGSDLRDGTAGTGNQQDVPGSRTDSILVLTKPKSGRSSLISIPRDSYVNVNNQDMKINAVAALAGYPALVGEVESITGMKIDHVVLVGFGGVEKVVDALDGVELCYDRTVNDARSGMNWKAGCHNADGATALAFSRMRYSDPTGDIGRAKRQRQVLSAVAEKAASPATLSNPGKVKKLAKAGLSSLTVDEDSSATDMVSMALAFRDATGKNGVNGSVYYQNIDYRPASGIGSCILLDGTKNTELFNQLEEGTHASGTVGGLNS